MYAKKYVKVLAQNIGLFDTDINVPPSPSDGLQISQPEAPSPLYGFFFSEAAG